MSINIKRVVLASASQSAGGNSSSQSAVTLADQLSLFLNVTVAASNSSLTVYPEWTDDNGTTWYRGDPAEAFTVVSSSPVALARLFPLRSDKFRVSWDMAGPGPYTFGVNSFGALL